MRKRVFLEASSTKFGSNHHSFSSVEVLVGQRAKTVIQSVDKHR
jgi:hypothetical protein